MCAYRSDTNVNWILPAGKSSRDATSSTDDVRTNSKGSRWKTLFYPSSASHPTAPCKEQLVTAAHVQIAAVESTAPLTSRGCSAEPGAGSHPGWWRCLAPASPRWAGTGGGLVAELMGLAPGERPWAPQGLQAAGSPDLGTWRATNPLFFPASLHYFQLICFFHFDFFTQFRM